MNSGQRPDTTGPVVGPRFVAQAVEVVALSAGSTGREKLIAATWEDAAEAALSPGHLDDLRAKTLGAGRPLT